MNAILHALATPRRREILRLVWERELTHGEIHRGSGDVTKGAVSQHLRVLAEAGLVTSRWEGNHRYFQARKSELGPLRAWLEEMWSSSLDRLAAEAELEAARRGPRQGPRPGQRSRPRSKGKKTTRAVRRAKGRSRLR